MKSETWKHIKDVLLEALDLDLSERREFLEKADISPEMRSEVESLLAFEEQSEDLMRLSAYEFSKDFFEPQDERQNNLIGQQIGVYEIVGELGYGGMGAVYLAERRDGSFSQRVALKMLKREMNTDSFRRRFQQERQILASLKHPHITSLLDAGTTADGVPFLAMEYVEGLPIDEYCNQHELDLTGRLNLFRTVCAAVNFAHRNLIVHRDLKPSNILVTADGVPKLLDFGISKILSTEFEQVNAATVTNLGAMTPSYASPEQLRGESVTTATDIYSLGVILYELLSGHRPFESKENNLREIYKAVIETDPLPPSALIQTISKTFKEQTNAKTETLGNEISNLTTLAQTSGYNTALTNLRLTQTQAIKLNPNSLRGDLDNIVLKALRKEPEGRYLSAENFAEDIRRHQDGLPVTARPHTFAYRAEKFIKRNRLAVGASFLIALALIGGMLATLWQARVARAERAKAENRFRDVRTLANSFLFEFSPKIENVPGTTAARELLVRRASEYLDRLARESSDDAELQRELAKSYEKVGDVQGNPFNPNIGDVKGALQSYEKARAIRLKLLESEPDNLEAQSDLAYNFEIYADIQSNGGDYSQGETNYDEALRWREKILERDPQNFKARENLARVLKSRGLIPFYEGENKKAIEYYDRAAMIYEQLRQENPDDYKIAQARASLLVNRGEALGWDGDIENAGTEIEKGLGMLLPLYEKHPHDQSLGRAVMLAYHNRGINYEDLKDYDKSIAAYAKSLEMSELALKADPQNVQSKRDVAIANKKLAGVLDLTGRSRESVEKLNITLDLFKELAANDPNNTEIVYDIANTHFSLAETYLTMKDYETALTNFQTAKDGFRQVLEINPGNVYAARVSSFALEGIGKCYAALAEKSSQPDLRVNALENFRAGLELIKKLKNDGNLAEYDFPAIDEMEKKIRQVEEKNAQ